MIPRYTTAEMGRIWSNENKFTKWLEVEKAVARAQAELGFIPEKAADDICKKAKFEISKISEIETETHHDVIAFLINVSSYVGDSSKFLHYGLTSSDVVDSALSLQLLESVDVIKNKVKKLIDILKSDSKKYAHTIMVGRTHGIHAEPITLGLKFCVYAFEMARNLKRLEQAGENIGFGKISGAVGTYANISPEIEKRACSILGLKPSPVSTQVIQRDRHAQLISTLAICGASLEKIALEIRNLQRTDIREVEEPFTEGQKGSSAMPHKKNPIICERICGLSRVLRSNMIAAMENISLWHERDISHSSVERIIIPDSFILLDYMLEKAIFVIEGLNIIVSNMKKNLMKYGGIVFSQRILLELIKKGMKREDAYVLVQKAALEAWNNEGSFKENLLKEDKVLSFIDRDGIEKLFKVEYHLKYIDEIIDRLKNIK